MKLEWIINQNVIDNFSKIYEEEKERKIVKDRIEENIENNNKKISRDEIWKGFINCQITSQQKSGPESKAKKLMKSGKGLLKYEYWKDKSKEDLGHELEGEGIRFHDNIAERLLIIRARLENGEWEVLENHLNTLKKEHTKTDERKVIAYLLDSDSEKGKKTYPGIGPKQSRNFLQYLGLSKYEIPIDSRALKTLKECGCEYVPEAIALQDQQTYELLEDGMQLLAEKLGIMPCVLDAVCFSHLEKKGIGGAGIKS